MENNDEEISVYTNITGLCAELSDSVCSDNRTKQECIKNFRSKAFNKLLFFKNLLSQTDINDFAFLTGDIFVEIHSLREKNLYHKTKKKREYVAKLLNHLSEEMEQNTGLTAVLQVLLLLANTNTMEDYDEKPIVGLDYRRYTNSDFLEYKHPFSFPPDSAFELNQINAPLRPKYSKLNFLDMPFDAPPGTGLSDYFSNVSSAKSRGTFIKDLNAGTFTSTEWKFPPNSLTVAVSPSSTVHMDEGYVTPDNDHMQEITTVKHKIDYWNVDELLKPKSSHYTWENLGMGPAPAEKPFLCHNSLSKLSVFHLWRILRSSRMLADPTNIVSTQLTEITTETLRQDVQYLLIGIETDTFYKCQERNSFAVRNGVYVAGVFPDSLQHYCEDFIKCANSYLTINNLLNQEFSQTKSKQGLVFMTFQRCVQRYLILYRGFILKIPFNKGLVSANHWIQTLRIQLEFLVNLCGEEMFGGALLVHLYDIASTVIRHDVAHMLYYFIESCCKVYFSYLEKWVFHGVCENSYGEFFIEAKSDKDINYDRQFWTQSFFLKKLLVPGFLKGLENDLFLCGKSMSLLKHCNINDPLIQCVKQGHPKFDCCLDRESLDCIYSECVTYKRLCVDKCGTRPKIFNSISEEEEENYKLSLMKHRENAMDKFKKKQEEIRKLKAMQKREVFDELKKGMEEEMARKVEARRSQILEDIKMLETAEELDRIEHTRREEEKKRLIKHYQDLSDAVEKQKTRAEWKLKRMQLHDQRQEFLREVQAQEIEMKKTIQDSYPESRTIGTATGDNLTDDSQQKAVIGSENFAPTDHSLVKGSTQEAVLLLDNENVYSQAEKNKKRVIKEEFYAEVLEKELCSDPKDSVVKVSEKEERIEKEMEEFNTAMQFSEEARMKAIKNREKAYGREYNIITGETIEERTRKRSENIVVTNQTENEAECTMIAEDSVVILENNSEVSSHSSLDEICVVDSAVNNVADKPLNNINTKSIYRNICDKHPMIIEIGSSVIPVEENPKKLKPRKIDITKLYQCLQKSISFPLQVQLNLVNDAILRLFVVEQKLVAHLECIRKYFFLLDSDYASSLTKYLFAELYSIKNPSMLLNHVRLNSLLRSAVGSFDDLAARLSFLVNQVPRSFHLTDPQALACLSMTYKVDWPLNAIITPIAISKYDQVFTFLMQLRRASWALDEDIYLLKFKLNKKSPQYRQVHLFRHVMAQFLQTLHRYFRITVMEHSWRQLKEDLEKSTNLDTLYLSHVNYIKSIIFRCLLNKRSKNVHKHLLDLFKIILTFHENLRSDNWYENSKGELEHPAFLRLRHQYSQFHELAGFLNSYIERLVSSGYQPHLEQFLIFLSFNNFYKMDQFK